jgi:hypothetical protein
VDLALQFLVKGSFLVPSHPPEVRLKLPVSKNSEIISSSAEADGRADQLIGQRQVKSKRSGFK